MSRRKTPDDYHALAKARGVLWLGPEVPTITTKTTWQCDQGHRWQTTYDSLRASQGCPVCAGVAPKTPGDYHTLAHSRDFLWLGPEVPNVRTDTWWQCQHGHRWQTNYHNIDRGSGCPTCRLTLPEDYHGLAERRGFEWLGPEVPRVEDETTWQCPQGHRWQAPYSRIARGDNCPHCAHTRRKTPADYQAIAEARGVRWLGPEVPNVFTPTSWECPEGHRWQAPYQNLRRGSGCPQCRRRG